MKTKHPRDLTGVRFGRLLCESVSTGELGDMWACLCDCGKRSTVRRYSLISGNTKSCGCLRKDFPRAKFRKHGGSGTRTYNIWCGMVDRCTNPSCGAYPQYGGRGISLCDRWRIFPNFLADMGPAPEGLSIDRIDNDKGYEPGNCRWATQVEQCNNTRDNHYVEWAGEKFTVAQLSRHLGISAKRLSYRLNAGWPLEQAVDPTSYLHVRR